MNSNFRINSLEKLIIYRFILPTPIKIDLNSLHNIYTIVFRALQYKENGKLDLLIILQTMFINVWFRLSTTLF